MAEEAVTSEAPQELHLVRLADVLPQFRQFCTPDLYLAKETCRHCWGRGYTGFAKIIEADDEQGIKKHVEGQQWCKCIMVNMNALADRMTALRAEHLKLHPEDLMTAGIMPPPQPTTDSDQANLEASNG
jgi:hypothetical protein